MVDFEYLYKGLCGLARAYRANPMAGHLGAAVVAGYFFGEDQHDLPDEVHAGIEKTLYGFFTLVRLVADRAKRGKAERPA